MNSDADNTISKRVACAILGLSLSFGSSALANNEEEPNGELKDAWLDGKIETAYALNRHLNPFSIDTRVNNGVVQLSGTVESDIDRDLAEQIALSVEGVAEVENDIEVSADAGAEGSGESSGAFMQAVNDATTTAVVKSKLLANGNTGGLQIDVDTKNGVVQLSGKVGSSEEKDLAERIAMNTDGVSEVNSQLQLEEGQ